MNEKKIPKICKELIKAYRCYWGDFQENDIPVFLLYGIIPPEKQREGLYHDNDFDRRLSSFLIKSHETSLLKDRGKLLDKLRIKLLREHSDDIAKKYEVKSFRVFTCEEALGKGYKKEIQKEITNHFCPVSWEK